jgi:hypothetical protein
MRSLTLAAAVMLAISPALASAEEKPADSTFTIGEGKLAFAAPEGWTKKQPKSRIIEAELEIPAADGDAIPGRLTAMGAGGSVEANIERWVGQFVDEGDDAKPKVIKKTVNDNEVHIVDLSGTYKDAPAGPFAGGKTTLRKDYRMLGAIIVTKDSGNYFLKLYGPKATIGAAEKQFEELVSSLKVK